MCSGSSDRDEKEHAQDDESGDDDPKGTGVEESKRPDVRQRRNVTSFALRKPGPRVAHTAARQSLSVSLTPWAR